MLTPQNLEQDSSNIAPAENVRDGFFLRKKPLEGDGFGYGNSDSANALIDPALIALLHPDPEKIVRPQLACLWSEPSESIFAAPSDEDEEEDEDDLEEEEDDLDDEEEEEDEDDYEDDDDEDEEEDDIIIEDDEDEDDEDDDEDEDEIEDDDDPDSLKKLMVAQ
jgi:hypothetical protein